jgi:5-formyltetrahydrofolate cyclo-ligase
MPDFPACSHAQAEKEHLRTSFRLVRDGIGDDVRAAANQAIYEQISGMESYRQARTILLYASFGSEVDTRNLIADCLSKNVRTVLPRVDKKEGKLVLYRILNGSELRPGQFGIPEPVEDNVRLVEPADIDLALIPGVAFDRTGARIGYGKGFYDRLLAGCTAPTAGVCFSVQLSERIPCEPHDRRVQIIVTEKGVIDCHGHEKD